LGDFGAAAAIHTVHCLHPHLLHARKHEVLHGHRISPLICSCHRNLANRVAQGGGAAVLRFFRNPFSCFLLHTYTHACTQTHARTHTHMRAHTHTRAHTQACMRTHTRAHTQTHTHTHTRAHAHKLNVQCSLVIGGRLEEAEPLFEIVYHARKKALGKKHGDVLISKWVLEWRGLTVLCTGPAAWRLLHSSAVPLGPLVWGRATATPTTLSLQPDPVTPTSTPSNKQATRTPPSAGRAASLAGGWSARPPPKTHKKMSKQQGTRNTNPCRQNFENCRWMVRQMKDPNPPQGPADLVQRAIQTGGPTEVLASWLPHCMEVGQMDGCLVSNSPTPTCWPHACPGCRNGWRRGRQVCFG